MRKINLIDKWFKILALLLCILITPLVFCILFVVDKKSIWASAFMVFAWLFVMFGLFVAFYAKIIIHDDYIIFRVFWWLKPKKYKIEIRTIENIYIEDNVNISNVIHIITNNDDIKFTGYNSLKGHFHNLQQSKKIVSILNELCNNKLN